MQSSGGIINAQAARDMTLQTLLSGPVGGAMGGVALADRLDRPNLIGVDMGGTSFDISLVVDGKPDITTEAELEGFPLLMSVVNIHTIGAGGGSIAYEEAGGLRVVRRAQARPLVLPVICEEAPSPPSRMPIWSWGEWIRHGSPAAR